MKAKAFVSLVLILCLIQVPVGSAAPNPGMPGAGTSSGNSPVVPAIGGGSSGNQLAPSNPSPPNSGGAISPSTNPGQSENPDNASPSKLGPGGFAPQGEALASMKFGYGIVEIVKIFNSQIVAEVKAPVGDPASSTRWKIVQSFNVKSYQKDPTLSIVTTAGHSVTFYTSGYYDDLERNVPTHEGILDVTKRFQLRKGSKLPKFDPYRLTHDRTLWTKNVVVGIPGTQITIAREDFEYASTDLRRVQAMYNHYKYDSQNRKIAEMLFNTFYPQNAPPISYVRVIRNGKVVLRYVRIGKPSVFRDSGELIQRISGYYGNSNDPLAIESVPGNFLVNGK